MLDFSTGCMMGDVPVEINQQPIDLHFGVSAV